MCQLRKNRVKKKFKGIKFVSIFFLVFLFLNSLTSAQTLPSPADAHSSGSGVSPTDSLTLKIPVSKDKPEATVTYEAKDSIVYDAKKKQLYLHNGASIQYDDIKINTDYVQYDQDSNRLTAAQIDSVQNGKDSTIQNSKLSQGKESSTFTALAYNFKSRRALIENAYSQYGEGFILSNQVKRNNDSTINGFKNIYTTCSDPHPHFGIGTRRIKIIPGKVAVSGAANLIIDDVPTPLFLPFGMFPLKQGQRSGFILPTYSVTQNLGFGLVGGGYYFALNNHYDLRVLSDIYTLGSWRLGAQTNYMYRYRFNGQFGLDYAYNKIGESFEPGNLSSRDFAIRWSHSINPNVLWNSSFSANVNIRSSKYNSYNTRDVGTYLNNNLNSNISYTKSWPGKPYSLTAALRHNQNTQTRLYTITLPDLNFNVNQIYPFQFRKNMITPRWYEKITATYNVHGLNTLSFYDSSFSWKNLRSNNFNNGFEHNATVNATYNVLRFFNWSLNADYHEYWYTKKFMQQFDFNEGVLKQDTMTGFFTARSYGFNSSFSTRIYGMKLFHKGVIRGIRHVLTPSITARFHPDFGKLYYYSTFVNQQYATGRFSYYAGSVIGMPGDGKEGGIGFNLGNTLQMKVRSRKDSVNGIRKINLIDGLDIISFYNLAVDSFRWSDVNVIYRTTLLSNVQFSGSMNFSPYAINKTTGRRMNDFYYETNKKLLRFQAAGLSLTASLPVKKNNTTMNKVNDAQKQAIGNNYLAYADFNVPWNLSLNYSIRFDKTYLVAKQKDTLGVTQDLNFFGDVNLTSKWKIGFRSGYDFRAKHLNMTSFDIYRDLHCWEMRMNLIPFGQLKSYNFTLNVKSAVLQDLKLVRRKDFRDFL